MIDFTGVVASESARFAEIADRTAPDARVPSCPDWSFADLVWHLTEVQEFWRIIVDELKQTPDDMARLERPDDVELAGLFRTESASLVEALTRRNGDEPCWSWHSAGMNTGWVMRRQAHEALIHRVDAELSAADRTPIDAELAADGVDEILTTMLDASDLPEWSRFEPTGARVTIQLSDQPQAWTLELGRFTGTSPTSATTYDEVAVRLVDLNGGVDTRIIGTAVDIDLWLWGRGGADQLEVDGDSSLVAGVREAAVHATQ